MSVEAALGALNVASKCFGLELTLSSSIKCTASEEDEAEELHRRLTAHRLNNDSLCNAFLYCGSSLLISITLQIEAALSVEQHDRFIGLFSTQLRIAMFWQQLCFSPPSIRTSSTEDDRTVIEVTLIPAAQSSDDPRRMQHQLGIGVPVNDIRPPPGLLAAMLDSVVLDVRIQHSSQAQSGSANTPTTKSNLESVADELTNRNLDTENLDNISSDELQDRSKYYLSGCKANSEHGLPLPFDFDDEEVDSLHSEMLLEASDLSSETVDQVLHLLDAAIRRAISFSSGPVAKGVRVQSDKSFTTLSSVAPALFRQQHLPAVTSRAIFIPTISKSILAIHSRQTISKSADRKPSSTRHLNHSAVRDNCTNGNAQQDTRSFIHQHIKHLPQLLWLTLDRGLLNATPERRLKPLSMPCTDSHCSNVEEQLLDVLSTPEECHLTVERSGSDDCFLDESFEEGCYSDYEEMLDDSGAVSDYGSDLDSDFGSDGRDGYDSHEELHWEHDYPFTDCVPNNNNHASYYDDDLYMPGDPVHEEDAELIRGRLGAITWRTDCKAPRPTRSPESWASSDDEMLGI